MLFLKCVTLFDSRDINLDRYLVKWPFDALASCVYLYKYVGIIIKCRYRVIMRNIVSECNAI